MTPRDFNNSNTSIFRDIIDDNISYKLVKTSSDDYSDYSSFSKISTPLSPMDVFLKYLHKSRKELLPELKQVILDIKEIGDIDIPINDKKGSTLSMLDYAVRSELNHVVEYLLSIGAKVENAPKLFDYIRSLSASDVTVNKLNLIKLILDNAPENWVTTLQYAGYVFGKKFLVIFINSGKLAPGVLETAYGKIRTPVKKDLMKVCPNLVDMAIKLGDEEYYPENIKDIFMF